MTALIAAHEVSYAPARGSAILSGVSIALKPGSRLAIIGPNGAGKTTLLRLLAGITTPTQGRVDLLGRPFTATRPVERARLVAVVGQTDQPDPRITLRDYVGLGRIPHGVRACREESRAIVERAVVRTGLGHLVSREMGGLSGSERQRAQIARALAQEPRVLFLDEPTNHLDPRARGDLLGLVTELDLTVVAVLHDLPLVAGFATEVAILDQGHLVAAGSPGETLTPAHVRAVFGVELLRLPHPREARELTVFDLPLSPKRSFA